MKKLLYLTFILLISLSSFGQIGFQNSVALKIDEPNRARAIIEYDSCYLLGGKYFDQSLGRWEIFFSKFNKQGELTWLKTLKSDTASSLIESNSFLMDHSGFLIGALRPEFIKFVAYNSELDSVFVDFKISTDKYNFICHRFTNNSLKDTFFLSGRNKISTETQDIMLLRVTSTDTTFIRTRNQNQSNNRLEASYLDRVSDNTIVLACIEQEVVGSEIVYSTYLLHFDSELNLVYNGWLEKQTIPVSGNNGLFVDSQGNIVVIGSHYDFFGSFTNFNCYPSIGKFNASGEVEWYRSLGNNIENNSQYGSWESVIESKEKDGYILVGGQIDETEFQDSLLGRAAIAKVSYEGDSLWMKTYSFRTPREDTRDVFTDVILSSDGYYVACGASYQRVFHPEDDPWIQSLIVKMDADGIYDPEGTSIINLSESNNEINIFPNPTSSRLYLTQSTSRKLRGKVMNQNGVVVEEFISPGIHHTHILDVSNFVSGAYHIIASDESGRSHVRKFIIQH